MAISDYNKNGRIPIVPLPYSRRSEAQGKELIVDYPNGGIYIADENDPSILYNITQSIIDNIQKMEASNMEITISLPGESEVTLRLGDIIEALYNNAIQVDEDTDENFGSKLLQLKSSFVKNLKDEYYSPITLADSVYMKNGESITDRINSIPKIGVTSESVESEEDGQREFEIPFPTPTYNRDGNCFEVFVGSTLMTKHRYETITYVKNDKDMGSIIFDVDDGLSLGRSVTFLFIYNASSDNPTAIKSVSGQYIADKSIPTSKLLNISDSIDNNNSSCLATSKAIKILNDTLSQRMNKICGNIAAFGTSYGTGSELHVTLDYYKLKDNCIIYLRLHTNLQQNATLSVNGGEEYPIYINDSRDVSGPEAGQTIALSFNEREGRFYLFNELTKYKIDTSFYSYTSTSNETEINFNSIGAFNKAFDKLNVYYNGIRLFEDIDYTIENNNSIELTKITPKTNDIFYFEIDKVVPIMT